MNQLERTRKANKERERYFCRLAAYKTRCRKHADHNFTALLNTPSVPEPRARQSLSSGKEYYFSCVYI